MLIARCCWKGKCIQILAEGRTVPPVTGASLPLSGNLMQFAHHVIIIISCGQWTGKVSCRFGMCWTEVKPTNLTNRSVLFSLHRIVLVKCAYLCRSPLRLFNKVCTFPDVNSFFSNPNSWLKGYIKFLVFMRCSLSAWWFPVRCGWWGYNPTTVNVIWYFEINMRCYIVYFL